MPKRIDKKYRTNHYKVDSYENRVLFKLRNQYSENEAVKLIEQENSQLRVENGKLSSYFMELEDRLQNLESMTPDDLKLWKIQKKINEELTKMNIELTKALQEKNHWKKKYLNLLPQITK